MNFSSVFEIWNYCQRQFSFYITDGFHFIIDGKSIGNNKLDVKMRTPPSSSSFGATLSLSLIPHYGPRPFSCHRNFHFAVEDCHCIHGMSMSILIDLFFFMLSFLFLFLYSKFLISMSIN